MEPECSKCMSQCNDVLNSWLKSFHRFGNNSATTPNRIQIFEITNHDFAFRKNIVYATHIFEEQLNSAQKHLSDVSAIQISKLVTSFKDE